MILISKKIADKTTRTVSKASPSAPMQTKNSAEI